MQIVGLGLVATFLAAVLNQHKSSITSLFIVFVGSVMFLILIDQIHSILQMIERVASEAKVSNVYVETLLKIIGIAYIAEFGAQITKDAGQGAIASKIELAGKILILVMAIPILTVVIETILGFLPTG
ncbi:MULTISPECIES: stage III sporulation protein AD [Bacillus]|uniref:Stage III sporulation protein AD n=12 Tax=Bacillus cereus group TaxID=86661 RepID=A0A249XFM3_BACCE|nr:MULTISPECIES: stage III sporulation protein AD [Bacillus]KAB0446459.1 stage III sporulation protein AD [Lysinibacillus sp. VIA-II-2016]MBJ8080118.1 stage III sporulation protein AD [Bacillus cereus group sp. N14]MBJ9979708.1 stage III sporulation protein AD [Bacillus sp. S29]MBK0100886.1 stage III sporulation protein AD [Bacillus sp. S70]MBK0105504.1 stage III sporulation protein AD [Bacillus sp. S73]MBK0134335.1 stage III sporulation protein AD [Bacillus sp. S72]MBK0149849.1 stage III sp